MATRKRPKIKPFIIKGVARGAAERNGAGDIETPSLVVELMVFIKRFLVVTDDQRLVLALWIIHTYLISHIDQTPYLAITSPEPACAKSRVLDVLDVLTDDPMSVTLPSVAVLYRQIDARKPTLLWDEIETIFDPKQARFHREERAIFNVGHRRRGAEVYRAAEFGKKVETFRCFCAKAFACIGTVPDTVSSRSIYIRMERKLPTETVDDFTDDVVLPVSEPLRERIDAWATKHGQSIGKARPSMPTELDDRMKAGCRSLVAIADVMGCGAEARDALVALLCVKRADTTEGRQLQLLKDIYEIWIKSEKSAGKPIPAIHTISLIGELHTLDERPWGGKRYFGRDLDHNDLARLLSPYDVESTTVNVKTVRLKGYKRDDLWPAFERYASRAEPR